MLIGNPSLTPSSNRPNIFYFEFNAASPSSIANTTDIDDVIKEFEQNSEMAKAISKAREKMAESLYGQSVSFSGLRLAAGLSQDQLAARVKTSQSHIAKIEAGKNDPSTDVIQRLAAALNRTPEFVFNAVLEQRKMREQLTNE